MNKRPLATWSSARTLSAAPDSTLGPVSRTRARWTPGCPSIPRRPAAWRPLPRRPCQPTGGPADRARAGHRAEHPVASAGGRAVHGSRGTEPAQRHDRPRSTTCGRPTPPSHGEYPGWTAQWCRMNTRRREGRSTESTEPDGHFGPSAHAPANRRVHLHARQRAQAGSRSHGGEPQEAVRAAATGWPPHGDKPKAACNRRVVSLGSRPSGGERPGIASARRCAQGCPQP